MRLTDRQSYLKQLDALDRAIQNNNRTLLEDRQELEKLEKLVEERKKKIATVEKQKEHNIKTFDVISEKLLDKRTIQKTLTYGLNKQILSESMISIQPQATFDQLSDEQKRALIDVLLLKVKQGTFRSVFSKGIDLLDDLVDKLTVDGSCEEDLENDN